MASGMMLRWRPKSHAIAVPPTKVKGTNTGLGQWHDAKTTPVSPALVHSFLINDIMRLCTSELSATC